jgi:hypothetical protein
MRLPLLISLLISLLIYRPFIRKQAPRYPRNMVGDLQQTPENRLLGINHMLGDLKQARAEGSSGK